MDVQYCTLNSSLVTSYWLTVFFGNRAFNKMAVPAKKISKQEWELNKPTILNLYHVRGLPLYKKGEGESVQRIMQSHGFTAR